MKRILTIAFIIFFIPASRATVKTWVGINTHWDDPNNWSPAGVPIKNDSVYINNGAANYPLLRKDLTVYFYPVAEADTSFYTCQYLFLADNARIDGELTVRHTITFSADADIYGVINLHGTIWCEQGWGNRVFHTNFTGAHLIDVGLAAGVAICGMNFPIDTYTNCYIEGGVSPNSAPFFNCTITGSVGLDPYFPPYMPGCQIRLKEKYGASIRIYNYQSCFSSTGPDSSFVTVNIVNDSNDDDTLYVFSNIISSNAHYLNGVINFNTTNECGRLYIGEIPINHVYGYIPCPVHYTSSDSTIIKAGITIQNKGIVEFRGPVALLGTMTANGGHFIKTYPCAVNTFPPGDTINCPLDLRRARIDLASGKLFINNALSADSILHADTSHYLVTLPNGTYASTIMPALGNVLFPVGTNSSYTPLWLNEAAATGNSYAVHVTAGVYDQGTSGNLYTSKVVDRTWHISKLTPNNANATLTLQWNAADELPNFFHDYCSVSHFSNGVWHSGPGGLATGTGPFQQTLASQTSFSPFAVGSGGVLPLGCLSFTGVQKENKIELSWTTGTGSDHYHFLVQRSPDGIHFSDIADMDAGIISAPRNFYYSDTRFLNGDNYYRVFEVDAGGNKIQLCNIIRIKGSAAMPFVLLLQNPVQQQLPLQFTVEADQEVAIAVYDLAGRKLIGQQAFIKKGTSGYSLDISALAKGQYLLKVSSNNTTENLFFTH